MQRTLVALALVSGCGLVRDLQEPSRPPPPPAHEPAAPWKPRAVIDVLPGFTGLGNRATDEPHRIADAFEGADDSMLVMYAPDNGKALASEASNVGATATLPCNARLDMSVRGLLLRQAEMPSVRIAPSTTVLVWEQDRSWHDRWVIVTPGGHFVSGVTTSDLAPRTKDATIVSHAACSIPSYDAELRPADPAAHARMIAAKAKVNECVGSIMKPAETKVDKMRLRHAYIEGHLRPQYSAEQLKDVTDAAWKRAQTRCSPLVPAATAATRTMLVAWEAYRSKHVARMVAASRPRQATRVAQP